MKTWVKGQDHLSWFQMVARLGSVPQNRMDAFVEGMQFVDGSDVEEEVKRE